ncbi:MAG: hypothetical protein HY754_01740 [Nitrospirae bacterium]|nr:hypothetical protein [Nitrospirota bacterium]
MKQFLSIITILIFFTACDNKPKNPLAEHGDAMIGSYKKAQRAAETANLDAIRKTVRSYYTMNEKYPQSLDEIKDMLGSDIDVSRYDYDPQTGSVSPKNR